MLLILNASFCFDVKKKIIIRERHEFFIVYKVITLNVQGKCTNCIRGVQTYNSHRIWIFFHLKSLSNVIHLYIIPEYSLYALVEAKISTYIMNNLIHVYVVNFPNLRIYKLVISFFFYHLFHQNNGNMHILLFNKKT